MAFTLFDAVALIATGGLTGPVGQAYYVATVWGGGSGGDSGSSTRAGGGRSSDTRQRVK